MAKHIEILDSSLRDGAQAKSVSFSVADKINIIRALDALGVDYIEAGNPFSNPKDVELFEKLEYVKLKYSKIVAFGSTRRKNCKAEDDNNCRALIGSGVDIVSIFGKSWDFHVTEIINTTLQENLSMITDTVKYLKDAGKTVFYDAEHYFDAYKSNTDYALKTLMAAKNAGADRIILCDTNGGTFPDEISDIVAETIKAIDMPVGIHCHNDVGCAVACTVAAVKAGALQVQGTYIGNGERCGNTNLSTIIANLQLKLHYNCIPKENIELLTQTARYIAEISNMTVDGSMPYVGKNAFAHKGGMHVDGVNKNSLSFEHIAPETVGNKRDILLSEVSGRTAVAKIISKFDASVTKESAETTDIMKSIKQLEYQGYQFEVAEASLELLIRKRIGKYIPFFELVYFKIINEQPNADSLNSASAVMKVRVNGKDEITAEEGDGPVNALDKALRKALEVFYPTLAEVRLIDYKVRVMETTAATAAMVRVLIESTDGKNMWTTVGLSTDIINASWQALCDSIEYKLLLDGEKTLASEQ